MYSLLPRFFPDRAFRHNLLEAQPRVEAIRAKKMNGKAGFSQEELLQLQPPD